jgi:hypothetical protein
LPSVGRKEAHEIIIMSQHHFPSSTLTSIAVHPIIRNPPSSSSTKRQRRRQRNHRSSWTLLLILIVLSSSNFQSSLSQQAEAAEQIIDNAETNNNSTTTPILPNEEDEEKKDIEWTPKESDFDNDLTIEEADDNKNETMIGNASEEQPQLQQEEAATHSDASADVSPEINQKVHGNVIDDDSSSAEVKGSSEQTKYEETTTSSSKETTPSAAMKEADNPLIAEAKQRVQEEESYSNVKKRKKAKEKPKSNKQQQLQKQQQHLHKKDAVDVEDEAVKAGARLLSRGLSIVSRGLNVASDGVRVGGDTTAGLLGSSVKIFGTAVKSLGTGLQATSKLMETDHTKVVPPSSFSSSTTRNNDNTVAEDTTLKRYRNKQRTKPDGTPKLSVARRSRQVAAKGVRALGGVLGGLGEKIVTTGSVTERYASAGAGLAADVVKLMEEMTGSLSSGLIQKKDGTSRVKLRRIPDFLKRSASIRPGPDRADPRTVAGRREASPFWVYGSNESEDGDQQQSRPVPLLTQFLVAAEDIWNNPSSEAAQELAEIIISGSVVLANSLLEDTEEVPSLTIELGVVLFICYLVSVFLLLPSKRSNRAHVIPRVIEISQQNGSNCSPAELTAASTNDKDSSVSDGEQGSRLRSFGFIDAMAMIGRFVIRGVKCLCDAVWSLVFFAIKVVYTVISLFFHRVMLLLYVYLVCWLYLSHASMVKSKTVQRNAEANGFRSLIALLGTDEMSAPETAYWMNAIIDHVWRVPFGDEKTPVLQAMAELGYPMYVSRAAQEEMKKRGCYSAKESDYNSTESPLCMPYGGLEPYISSTIGAMLVTELDANKDYYIPSDIAYVTLHSFTLGRRPPVVRSVELVKAILGQENRKEGDRVEIDVDLDVLLHDLSFVLGK